MRAYLLNTGGVFLGHLKNNRAVTYLELIIAMAILSIILIFSARMDLFAARASFGNRELTRMALVAQEFMEERKAGRTVANPLEGYGFTENTPCSTSELSGLDSPYLNIEALSVAIHPASASAGVEDYKLAAYRLKGPQFPYITGIVPNWQKEGEPPGSITITGKNTSFSSGSVVKIGTIFLNGTKISAVSPERIVIVDTSPLRSLAEGKYDLQITTGSEVVPPLKDANGNYIPMLEAYTVGPQQQGEPPPEPPVFTFDSGDWDYRGNWSFEPYKIVHHSENWQPAFYKKCTFKTFDFKVDLVYNNGQGNDKDYKGGIVVGPDLSDGNATWFYMDRNSGGKIDLYLKTSSGGTQLILNTQEIFAFGRAYTLEAVAANNFLTFKFNGIQVKSIPWSTTTPSYLGLKDDPKGVEVEYHFQQPK